MKLLHGCLCGCRTVLGACSFRIFVSFTVKGIRGQDVGWRFI